MGEKIPSQIGLDPERRNVRENVYEEAMRFIEERVPQASPQKKAAFANSAVYLVTGWSGGYGGPSVREHLAGYMYGGGSMTFDQAVKVLLDNKGPIFSPIAESHYSIWRNEHCFDDDPKDIEALEHFLDQKSSGKKSAKQRKTKKGMPQTENIRRSNEIIDAYLEGIENREESVYRLSSDPQIFTDPKGIDPIHFLPPVLKKMFLGDFVRQGLEDPRKFDHPEYFGLPSGYSFPNHDALIKRMGTLAQETMPADYLDYSRGYLEILQPKRGAEGLIIMFNSALLPHLYGRYREESSHSETESTEAKIRRAMVLKFRRKTNDETYPVARLHIWDEGKEGPRLLGLSVDASFENMSRDIQYDPQEHDTLETSIEEKGEFIANPADFLRRTYAGDRQSDKARRERAFVSYWKSEFKKLSPEFTRLKTTIDLRDGQRFEWYPGQQAEPLPGVGVAIFEQAIKTARDNGYEGITATPAYFHSAENFEKQGLRFEDPDAAEQMKMLKAALRVIDQKRFDAALREAKGRGLSDREAYKKGVDALLTPQERSWIVLLNSVRDQSLIPPEFNLTQILGNALKKELQKRYRGTGDRKINYTFPLDHDVLMHWSNLLRKPLQFSADRMIYRFEKEASPEFAQASLDELIENQIVTGDTLNPPGSYVESFLESNINTPYLVIYHMYDKDGFVEEDNQVKTRPNVEHFNQIKRTIESFGMRTRIEKAQGNVRNPGPNHPLGWKSEEPSVVNDMEHGIERSSQNTLIVNCKNLGEAERVLEYLEEAGYKTEDKTGTDPRWLVPDIRILGISEKDYAQIREDSALKKFVRPALLHVRRGLKDGYASTLAHETHRLVTGFRHIPVLIHHAMDDFIRKDEEKLGEYEFVGR